MTAELRDLTCEGLDLTEAIAAAQATREYQAGQAFDVPADAVGTFTEAIIRAAVPHLRAQVLRLLGAELERRAQDWRARVDKYVPRFQPRVLGRAGGLHEAALLAQATATHPGKWEWLVTGGES